MKKSEKAFKQELSSTVQKQTLWALTFTKKLVTVVVIFFVMATTYAGFMMYKFQDISYLGSVYDAICHLVEVVAFGYLLKAGCENVPKILNSFKKLTTEDEQEEHLDEEVEL